MSQGELATLLSGLCGALAIVSHASAGSEGASVPANSHQLNVAAETSATVAMTPPPLRHLAAGRPILIELAQEVSTKRQRRGDVFDIRLAEAIVLDGQTVIPAGATGRGEVVDASPGGIAGRPAKLILAARYLDYPGGRLAIRGFKMAATGRDNASLAIALSATPYVGILALGISGGDVDYPAGTRAIAKVSMDSDLPDTGGVAPAQPSTVTGPKQ